MWMTDYIREIKRQLRDTHNFVPTGGTENDPTFTDIPDGHYPMTIEGRVDDVRIENNTIHCCNFADEK